MSTNVYSIYVCGTDNYSEGWFCKQRLVMCLTNDPYQQMSNMPKLTGKSHMPDTRRDRHVGAGQPSVESWDLRRETTHKLVIFFAAYTLMPLLTDHLFPCVCICHERSGDAYLNTCIIRRAQSLACTCKVLHIRQRRRYCTFVSGDWIARSDDMVPHQ